MPDLLLPHPTLGCLCEEGRVIDQGTVRFLPGVHDCAYIRERNARLRPPPRISPERRPGAVTMATGRPRVLS